MDSQRKFFESQYPVVFISRIMGLAPFSFNIDSAAGDWVQLSFPWLVYSLVLYSGYLFSFAHSLDVSWKIPLERNYPFISVIGGKIFCVVRKVLQSLINCYFYSLGHMLQIMLGLVIFNVCYILNFLKAKQMSRIAMALFNVDVELGKLAAPCKDLVDHKKGQRHKWIFIVVCVAFFVFMVVFDCLVFRE